MSCGNKCQNHGDCKFVEYVVEDAIYISPDSNSYRDSNCNVEKDRQRTNKGTNDDELNKNIKCDC
jgi:hypothetical protein